MHDSCLELVEIDREVTRDGGRLVVKKARLQGDEE
jgi:hypothetical protein